MSLVELYYDFLKENKIFSRIYTHKPNIIPTRKDAKKKNFPYSISGFSNAHTFSLFDESYTSRIKCYVFSQLWRGYVLDNCNRIKFVNDNHKAGIISELKADLRINGTRGSEKVRDILRRHNIAIIETN